MLSRSAVTKLRVLLIIDLLIVAFAAGSYYLVQRPMPAEFQVTNLTFDPFEAGEGQPIIISVNVTNVGDEAGDYSVGLIINDVLKENKTVRLSGGASTVAEFTVTEAKAGTYNVKIGNLSGIFKITAAPITPTHRLSIIVIPYTPDVTMTFTINGTSYKPPYSALLNEGWYTIHVPEDPSGGFTFVRWLDGSMDNPRTIYLARSVSLTGMFVGEGSCPSLFIWNGTSYVYVAEVSNHGWLGYTRYVNEDGSLEYWRNNPWDYIPLNKNQLQPNNGYYNLNLTQRSDEIFFIDSAYMLVVDHPSNQNVYSTMVEQYVDPAHMGKIYTVSKNPLKPVSASNEIVTVFNGIVSDSNEKVDALPAISNIDGVFTTGFNGKYSQAWNNQTWNRLTLNLGNLAGAPQINLVVRAIVDWGPPESYSLWMDKFYSVRVPNHTEPTPTPFMEVKDANGNWVRVPESRQIPLPPDGVARTFVVNLTDLFPTNDYSLRINNFWNVTFDYIGIDTTPQTNVTIQRIDPHAILYQAFTSLSVSSGNFTSYGDVTQLVLNEDDEFVIGRQGDAVSLRFPTANLAPIPEGMGRDYFFFVACWFKVEYANYGFGPGFGFTVDPLPFHNMSGFPYPLDTESYPYDAHLRYMQEDNTRVINPPSQPQPQESSLTKWVVAVIILVAVINLGVLVHFRKRSR